MSTLSGTPATSNAASRPLSMKPSTGGNARALRLLIRFGADLRIKDHCGRTPLALAIEISKLELAEMLVRNSANGNHNIRDSFGHSPAALARKKGYNELASSILRLSTRAPSPIESSSMNSSLISTPEASFIDCFCVAKNVI
uniref:ANK_REP_REGION domain-containing protein n=1 Tax=Panagrellus redivivus TaxID=6233 RepID=A0A7E4V589_PANRE